MMDTELIDCISSLCKNGKWQSIVNDYYDYPNSNTLLWVFPSEDNLMWLKEIFVERNVRSVISVGCGSGLLEWILECSTGFPVIGIEIDGAWWGSKYAKSFIPLHFASIDLKSDLITKQILTTDNAALLFCYFNDESAFREYLKCFKGDIVLIIGPGKGRGTHTAPAPFDTAMLEPQWKLVTFIEVRKSRDFIAVYDRV